MTAKYSAVARIWVEGGTKAPRSIRYTETSRENYRVPVPSD